MSGQTNIPARLSPRAMLLLALVILAGAGTMLVLFWADLQLAILQTQNDLQRRLVGAMQAARDAGAAAPGVVIALSFLYGIFHAAGPGHGKLVISTYMLTTDQQLRRGVVLSFLSAQVQGLVALALVGGLVMVMELTARDARLAADQLGTVSFALVTLLGLAIMYLGIRRLRRPADAPACGHSHGAEHAHGSGGCGHSHGPAPGELPERVSLLQWGGILLSVGIRPCSGALLVLIFCFAAGLPGTGVLSVFAMSLGTGATVAFLAWAAVRARGLALRLTGMMDLSAPRVFAWAATAGGFVIALMGAQLLAGAVVATQHPLF